jgi:RNA polymerase sigma-70 factor (ECF subfamily)
MGPRIESAAVPVAGEPKRRAVIYCIVPTDLADRAHDVLREHFLDEPGVEVVVEMRSDERRARERRSAASADYDEDRRQIRGTAGRRVAERRAQLSEVEMPTLPRRARAYADRLRFVRRMEPTTQRAHDIENARLVTRFQAGEKTVFSEIYMRNFDAVYGYARMALRDHHEAEDVTQQVFVSVMAALPRYELRGSTPFRAWLFRIARNEVLTSLRKRGRLAVEEPESIERHREEPTERSPLGSLDWISDADLLFLLERLPQMQRQAITLRYLLDLSTEEMCLVLDRTPVAVRKLEHRALRFLEERLAALRSEPVGSRRARSGMTARLRRAPVLGARRFALSETRGRERLRR